MNEWRRGWRVVLGASIASGLGIPLFYYTFSLFTLGMTKEFGVSRGELANLQALIVVGALVAPLIGRLLDRLGFAIVFAVSTLSVVAGHILMATTVSTLVQFAMIAFLYGAAGVGCGPLAYTRPISAWFWKSRGLALGVASLGLAATAAIAPPLLAALIESYGWRAGYGALAIVAGLVGLPLTLLLVRDAPPEGPAGPAREADAASHDRSHFRESDFWLLAFSLFAVAIGGAGLVSQLSPLVQEEGIGAGTAALGVTGYAIGQVFGRIVAGWFLDRSNPRIVAFLFTFLPAIGFILLAAIDLPVWAALLAVALIGIQQGAEIDLWAFFTSRRFGLARYGTVYGWIIAAAWIGNAAGILTFGWLHDATGDYVVAEGIAAVLMVVGAALIARVRIAPVIHH
jgi:MFS family permease